MIEIKNVPTAMTKAARKLKLGELLIVYRDEKAIRCELEDADDPYVWRNGRWWPMRSQ